MLSSTSSLKTVLEYVNSDSEHGLYLPNIQRNFVWDEKRIIDLLDSIVQGYPIPSLLIWITAEKIYQRSFIRDFSESDSGRSFQLPPSSRARTNLVLDGQQRLQSLYISIHGTLNGKYLYINLNSSHDQKGHRYQFKFMTPEDAESSEEYWVQLSEIVSENSRKFSIDKYVERFSVSDDTTRARMRSVVEAVLHAYNKGESPMPFKFINDDFSYEEVAEIFIRYNKGGKPLTKPDFLFSLGLVKWPELEKNVTKLERDIRRDDYNIDRDFILKALIYALELGVNYSIKVFQKDENIALIKGSWVPFAEAVLSVFDFLKSKTIFKHPNNLKAPNRLLPFIYFRLHFKAQWDELLRDEDYLASLITAFMMTGLNQDDSESAQVRALIKEHRSIHPEIFVDFLRSRRRSFQTIAEEIVKKTYYQKKGYEDFLVLSIIHHDIGVWATYKGNALQKDHIFPDTKLRSSSAYDSDINQLTNLMLLRSEINKKKRDKNPYNWLSEQNEDFFERNLIPKDSNLWKLENYSLFIETRKKLLIQRLSAYFHKVNQRLPQGRLPAESQALFGGREKKGAIFYTAQATEVRRHMAQLDDNELCEHLNRAFTGKGTFIWRPTSLRQAFMDAATTGKFRIPWSVVKKRMGAVSEDIISQAFELLGSGDLDLKDIRYQINAALDNDQIYWLKIFRADLKQAGELDEVLNRIRMNVAGSRLRAKVTT
jgi:hypothetical protein